MRTPAGKECRHYYQDFNRGRELQECRLIKYNPASLPWRPGDCRDCPVPEILNANASPHMELTLTIVPKFVGLGRRKQISATCTRHHIDITVPYVGCPECNSERPGLDAFARALEADDDSS